MPTPREQSDSESSSDSEATREEEIGDQGVARGLPAHAAERGLDGKALLEKSGTSDVEDQLQANTEEAVAQNVFGTPTFIYEGELFWGQDRLDFLERAIAG